MRKLKVTMAYRGTAYHGYQRQNNGITIQEVVERCAGKILNEPVTIHGCSRTDAGVHANRYVFHVETNSTIRTQGFIRGVNGELPDDISILTCEDADPEFHARFSCKGKEYLYLLHVSESKDPFSTDLACHYRRKLNRELVYEAAQHFVGTHDFRAFCSNSAENANTVRTVYSFDVEIHGDKAQMLVKGDGFLYNMVRIMVGTLLDVNEGKIAVGQLDTILRDGIRKKAGRTAPAHGLYLNRIFYDEAALKAGL
ncbi:MAG: tRNA pseudouridine(38-40) synthase TruA [Oscillospiraceae bacterium]|nr:tRNA pseudouridine(38-40) synthase TruA [Oscillospiraceae bacterium]